MPSGLFERLDDKFISLFLVALAIGFAALALPDQASADVLTRAPYIQMGTPTEFSIRWRSDVATDSRVMYGTVLGSLTSMAEDASLTTEHEVKVTGLVPDTKYFYSVGSSTVMLAGDDSDHFFTTSPIVGIPTPTRVLVLGDSGGFFQNATEVRDAYRGYAGANPADLWLMLGDNALLDGTDSEYQSGVFDMFPSLLRTRVLWPSRGNHDQIYDGDNNDYYDIFTMPTAGEAGGLPSGSEAYYSFDYANIHFICLDSQGSNRGSGGPMLTWLAADLAATSQDWIIAFFHHPPYSKGTHDSDTGDTRMIEMRENAIPILEAGGADLVMVSHSHAYERSMLIDGHYSVSSTLDSSMIVDGGDGRSGGNGPYRKSTLGPDPNSGTVYVTLGSSSWLQIGGDLDHPAMIANELALGFILLDVDYNRLDVTFVDELMTVRDYFSIVKDSPTGAPFAIFTATPSSGTVPVSVSFDGTASFDTWGDPITHDWDFGDGATDSGATVDHIYTNTGNFTASLTVDDGEFSDSVQKEVSVFGEGSTEGMLAYWKLDESSGTIAADSIGLTDGMLVNGPVWQSAGGVNQGALEFDGVDDRIDLGPLDIDSGTGLTMSVWLKADDLEVGDSRLISKATGTSSSEHYWMLGTLSENKLRFRLRTGGLTSTLISDPEVFELEAWAHVAATYDGTDMRLYVNGTEMASLPLTGQIDTNPSVLAAIGNQPDGADNRPFDGLLDDVRIYNRALTDSEIALLVDPDANQPPSANFDATPTTGTVPLLVAFDGSASFDPEGEALNYSWNFGNGDSDSAANPNYTYTTPGTYTVVLTVGDGQLQDIMESQVVAVPEPDQPTLLFLALTTLAMLRIKPGDWLFKRPS